MKGKSYFSAGVCFASLLLGVAAFLVALLVFADLLIALLFFFGVSLIFSLYLPLNAYLGDRRYRDVETAIPDKVILMEQISVAFPANGREGYLCLTEKAIYLVLRDRRPYLMLHLPRERLLSAEVKNHVCLQLRVLNPREDEEDGVYAVITPRSKELLRKMREIGLFPGK